MGKKILYADANSRIGSVKVFECPHCRDGAELEALRKVAEKAQGFCLEGDEPSELSVALADWRKLKEKDNG